MAYPADGVTICRELLILEIRQVAVGVAGNPDRNHISLLRTADGETIRVGVSRGETVVLSIEGNPDTGYSVVGFSTTGALATDSWFQSLEEARAYATAAYAIDQSIWVDVPENVLDMHGYAMERLGPEDAGG